MWNRSLKKSRRVALLFAAGCLCVLHAWQGHAADITWVGSVSDDWFNPANWNPAQVPTVDDVVWINNDIGDSIEPDVVITGNDAFCAGIVLGEGATLEVGGYYTLHVIGEGDLDGDGVSDYDEYLESLLYGFYIDEDILPNYADEDSDGDGSSDACEFEWINEWHAHPLYTSTMHPYIAGNPTDDNDLDGFTNVEECAAGSSPVDANSIPPAVPVYSWLGLLITMSLVIIIAVWAFRRGGRWAQLGLALIVAGVGLGSSGIVLFTKAYATGYVNFTNQTLQDAADSILSADTLEIDGGSLRPWNGATTYVSRIDNPNALTLKAVNGAVYLGGMRTSVEVGVQGQGRVDVLSAWTDAGYSGINVPVYGGTFHVTCYLGEKLDITAFEAPQWAFYNWTGDATGITPAITYQASSYDTAVQGNFSPPGPDLLATWDDPVPSTVVAGDSFAVNLLIENIGQQAVSNIMWADGIYLSRDAVLDEFDLYLLHDDAPSDSLAVGVSYNQEPTLVIPDVAPGQYYLIGVADIYQAVDTEFYKNNNTAATATAALNVHLAQ